MAQPRPTRIRPIHPTMRVLLKPQIMEPIPARMVAPKMRIAGSMTSAIIPVNGTKTVNE